jgi:TetR/AcrR family transcriptional regulator
MLGREEVDMHGIRHLFLTNQLFYRHPAGGMDGIRASAGTRSAKPRRGSAIGRKRPKPRTPTGPRDADRTRALLLSTARQEFALQGLAGARVDEIAAKAGISKQIIYYYFGSKDELFQAALVSSYEEILANNLDYLRKAPKGSPASRLRSLIAHFFDRIGSHREVISLIVEENRYGGQHLRHTDLPHRSSKPIIGHIAEILKEGKAAGLFQPNIDARQLFLDIMSMCLFYFTNLYTVSAVVGADLSTPAAVKARRASIVRSILDSLAAKR